MGNKNTTPTANNNHDVTEGIRKSVQKMIARATVNKNNGKEFDVDLDKCENFIKNQIELIPPSKSDKNAIYQYVSVVRNGIPRPMHIPISHEYISDHTTAHKSSREIGIKATLGAEATAGGEAKGGKEEKKDGEEKGKPSAPTASVNAKLQGAAKVTVTPEFKKKESIENINKEHEKHHYGERDVPGNADVVAPSGKRIYNLQLELRALKTAKLEVYRKFDVGPEAGLRIGVGVVGGVAGGAAAGAAVGAVAGAFVPIIGNIVGGAVGAIVGGIGGGAAAGGAGVGAVGARVALDTITLTAMEIFKESIIDDSDNKGLVVKGRYVHCIINYPYEADFDTAQVSRN